MQVFKTAIKTVLRHPMYLIVYAGFLSMMGVFIASGLTFGGTNDSEFSPYETKFAVIDRDGSALSDGLAAYLREQASKCPSKTARWHCRTPWPRSELVHPHRSGRVRRRVRGSRAHRDELPTLETVYSFYSTEGSLMDQMVNSYLGIAARTPALKDRLRRAISCSTQPRPWPNRRKRTAWKWAEPRPRRSGSCSSSNGAPTPCSPPSSCASA